MSLARISSLSQTYCLHIRWRSNQPELTALVADALRINHLNMQPYTERTSEKIMQTILGLLRLLERWGSF
jgi:hypothetical protein